MISPEEEKNPETFKESPSGRPRWPLILALLAIGLIYSFLPESLTVGPGWLLLVVIGLLVTSFVVARMSGRHKFNHLLGLVATGIVTGFLVITVALLVFSLPTHRTGAVSLLFDAISIWATNVLTFAIWYWQVDGGGPMERSSRYHESADFLFPQMSFNTPDRGIWIPEFTDYLFLAFNTSTALSPTDTAVLSRRAKLLMMVQASISLVVIAVLAARAINIL